MNDAAAVTARDAGTLASRLRAATRDRHARLEAITGLPDSLRTREDLVATLADLYGFHAAVEARAAPAASRVALGLPPCAASRRAWLADDLVRLGVAPERVAALPLCPGLGPFDTTGARLGCAWVVEGSALGGRVIQAHLHRHAARFAPDGRPLALRFLNGHGAESGRLWRRFGEALEKRAAEDGDAIVAAACRTFDALGDWFARPERGAPR